jgi:predicted secreted protein
MSRWLTLPVPWPMAVAMFVTIWWILLFAVLPFGVQSQHETAEIIPGTDPGAPVAPRMGRRLIWTTLISAVLFAASMLAYDAGYLNVERLSKLLGLPF